MTESGSIRNLDLEDLRALAALHVRAFPRSAMTKLGLEAVRRYYEWLLVGPHQRTALGVFDGETLVAFSFGGRFRGALTGFLRRNRGYLALHVATHPWLVATPLFRERIALALRLLRPKRAASSPSAPSPPAFGILAIAVDPAAQGRGVGRALMMRSEEVARAAGFARMQLTVATWNTQAIEFYQRIGWHKAPSGATWTGAMTKVLSPHVDVL